MPHALWTFDATPAAVRTVRGRMSEIVREWGAALDDDQCAHLRLVASELLTNGLLHVGGRLTAEITLDQPYLIVEVTDGDPRMPRRATAHPYAEQGRGLVLLDALCLLHGYEPVGTGKRCYAVLSLIPRTPGAAGRNPHPEAGRAPRRHTDRWTLTPAAYRLLRRLSHAGPAESCATGRER
ncbi:ATP-binding protein [Streptomyces longwoodensis]|uniref:ATP-binding protein n=1 Tax=Streptomyces longwoodensis TaxID=68231 RepID=UPI002DD8994F|nr:ATP-binding protein [Streptomyces longwoodensis]WRY91831.1 ATP-binding protein [Streptomyces longwoodensis]